MADSTFTFRVDGEPKAAFAEVAAAREHTAAQLLRVLMRDEARRWHESQEHDTWFRSEVEQALRDADDPRLIASRTITWSRVGASSARSSNGARPVGLCEGRVAA